MATIVSGNMDITLDDASPMITYSGSWSQDHTSDPDTGNYFYRTFHATTNANDTATIAFNGTGISIYGAKRSNHGEYQVQVDNMQPTVANGNGNELFQQQLFSVQGLSNGQHKLVLTNVPLNSNDNFLDLDFAVIHRTPPGTAANNSFTTQTYDDGNAPFTYSGSWTGGPIQPTEPPFYHDSTAHINEGIGDTMTFSFIGDSVQLFGGLYVDHGEYQATLDGVQYPRMNGTAFQIMPDETLFYANGLGQSQHTLVITNLGGGPRGQFIDIDYAVVNSTWGAVSPSLNPTSTASSQSPTGSTSSPAQSSTGSSGATAADGSSTSRKSNSHAGAIAGGVVGGVAALAIIALLLWFFVFRRRRGGDKTAYGPVGGRGKGAGDRGMIDLAAASGAGAATGAAAGAYGRSESASSPRQDYASSPYMQQNQGQGAPASNMWGGSSQGYTEYATNLSRGGVGDGAIPPYGMSSPGGASGSGSGSGPTPYLSAVPPPPASNATSYQPGGSVAGDHYTAPSGGITPFTGAPAAAQPGAMPGNVKQMGVALPFTAQPVQHNAAAPTSEPRSDAASMNSGSQGFHPAVLSPSTDSEPSIASPQSGRMQRMGRESDAGPYVPR